MMEHTYKGYKLEPTLDKNLSELVIECQGKSYAINYLAKQNAELLKALEIAKRIIDNINNLTDEDYTIISSTLMKARGDAPS